MQGRVAYDARAGMRQMSPLLFAGEIGAIWLPLLFHGFYGLKLSLDPPPDIPRHPYGERRAYTLQRVSGLAAFAFIAYHFCQFRLKLLLGEMTPTDFFPILSSSLSSTTELGIPAEAVIYLLGIAAVTHHFAYGLYAACFTWGVVVSDAARRLAALVSALIGGVLFLMAVNTVLFFATGVPMW